VPWSADSPSEARGSAARASTRRGMSSRTRRTSASGAPAESPTRQSTCRVAVGVSTVPTLRAIVTTTAAGIISGNAAIVPTARPSVVHNAATDVNHMLGRPGGYASKTSFTDTRINRSDVLGLTRGDVGLGGGVEVYPNSAGAVARANYISRVEQAIQMPGLEYIYTSGGDVLRIPRHPTSTEAQAYTDAFGPVLRAPVTTAYGTAK
jgi:hypothetical protein